MSEKLNVYGETHAQMVARVRREAKAGVYDDTPVREPVVERPRLVQRPLFYFVRRGPRAGWHKAQ